MTQKRSGFIDVDKFQQQAAAEGDVLERVAAYYGRDLPAIHQTTNETRLACLFACGKEEETGDRVFAVRTEEGGCVFNCFQYGCQTRGNLLSLMWWMKHDTAPEGGRLKGRQFREIAEDLQSMMTGDSPAPPSTPAAAPAKKKEPAVNVPLIRSENERARELVNLDERFVRDVADMNPAASQYVRGRRYLTSEMMEKFRCGYLPSSGGSLLRGNFVYPWLNADGDVLTWFGRNVKYEQQHRSWRESGSSEREPDKFKFVKGFHRGQEIWNEQRIRVAAEQTPELLEQLGVIVVEGPNDVIALEALGVPAAAICSNKITEQQARKLAEVASEVGGGTVTVMFDLDNFGIRGAEQAVTVLAKYGRVRLGWHPELADGRFLRQQTEMITADDWKQEILPHLTEIEG